MDTNIKIGWSEQSITPEKRISLVGQFYERISEAVETPITATAWAVDCNNEQMVIVSCDLTGINPGLQTLVREKLEGKVDGLPLDKIMLHATHTHASHLYSTYKTEGRMTSLGILEKYVPEEMLYKPLVTVDETIMTPDEALEFISDRIALAIEQAWNNRKPAVYACGFGRAAVGMNRRVCFSDGSAQMWGDTNSPTFTHLEGGNDNGVEMLFTFDTEKNPTGVILNIACPSQVMEHRNFISSDYWGKVKINLRKKFGEDFKVLGLCSPAGDICPRDLIRWQNGETPVFDPNISRPNYIERRSDGSMFDVQGTVRIGKRIANEVFDAYEEINEYFTNPEFVHITENVSLPIRRVTLKDYNDAVLAIEKFVEKNKGKGFDYNDTAAMHVYAGTIARYEAQQTRDLFDVEAHFVRLGDIAFATNPFELFLDYGNQIRARSLAKQTFLIQLCCTSCGYLPTKTAEEGSHYSAYVSSGQAGHEGGDLLVRKTLTTINSFFK